MDSLQFNSHSVSTFKQFVVENRIECFKFWALEAGDMTRSICINFDGVLSLNMFISIVPIKRVYCFICLDYC